MSHCRICLLDEGHPGVSLGDDGACSLCKLDVAGGILENFKFTRDRYEEFRKSPPNPHGPYDCLLMYSGGKDSTYMLDKFVQEGKRVLAYTFDVPFESRRASENVQLARSKVSATFVVDKDDHGIKRMMQEVFNRPKPEKPGKYLDEKLPCVSCRTFFLLRAILTAYKQAIPYVVLCADPQQILTMESNIPEIIRGYYRVFGEELLNELFGDELESLLFADEDRIPQIVFPFIEMRNRYDPDQIISELKKKDLYRSSPLETHCKLFPLLNYYSFKNWDCMFYKLNVSSHIRALRRNSEYDRATYSMRFSKDMDLLRLENELKSVLFEIAAGEGDRVAQEKTLIAWFKDLGATDEAAHYATQNFLEMPQIAADTGIKLE